MRPSSLLVLLLPMCCYASDAPMVYSGSTGTGWASRCITAGDNATVLAKCNTWLHKVPYCDGDCLLSAPEQVCVSTTSCKPAYDETWVRTNCFEAYCLSVLPRAGSGAVALSTTRDHCTGANCQLYRIAWTAQPDTSNAQFSRALKLFTTTKPQGTEWMLLPTLAEFFYKGTEVNALTRFTQSVDAWLDDLGTITQGKMVEDRNVLSQLQQSGGDTWIPGPVSITKVGAGTTTDLRFREAFTRANVQLDAMVVNTRSDWYDLVNDNPVCIDRKLCPNAPDHNGYGQTVPSWRERYGMLRINGLRTDAAGYLAHEFGEQYGVTQADGEAWVYDACTECRGLSDRAITSMPSMYWSLPGTEGARIGSLDDSLGRGGGHATSDQTVTELGLADGGFTTRVDAHLVEPCINPDTNLCVPGKASPSGWPFAQPDTLRTPVNWAFPSGRSTYNAGGASEGFGDELYYNPNNKQGSCCHFGGQVSRERQIASLGYWPKSTWTQAEAINMGQYSPGVLFGFGGGKQNPWSNRDFNTFQPIATGVHFLYTKAGTQVLRFGATWSDHLYTGAAPQAFEVVIDDEVHAMTKVLGTESTDGSLLYEYDMAMPAPNAACMTYFFRATSPLGTFALPQSGDYVYHTYGIGTCTTQWGATTSPTNRASCGYPGAPCQCPPPPLTGNCKVTLYQHHSLWGSRKYGSTTGDTEVLYTGESGATNFPIKIIPADTSSVKVEGMYPDVVCEAYGYTDATCQGNPSGPHPIRSDTIHEAGVSPPGIVSGASRLTPYWGCNDCARCVRVVQVSGPTYPTTNPAAGGCGADSAPIPTPAGTPTPAPSPPSSTPSGQGGTVTPAPAPPACVTQTVRFPSLLCTEYSGDVKKVYECAYAGSILAGSCTASAKQTTYMSGITVTSTCTSRRTATIEYKMTVLSSTQSSQDLQTAADALTSSSLATLISSVRSSGGFTAVNISVANPIVASPTVAVLAPSSDGDGSGNTAMIAGILVGVVVLVAIAVVAVLYFCTDVFGSESEGLAAKDGQKDAEDQIKTSDPTMKSPTSPAGDPEHSDSGMKGFGDRISHVDPPIGTMDGLQPADSGK